MRFLVAAVVALVAPHLAAAQDDDSAERAAKVEVIKDQFATECFAMNEAKQQLDVLPSQKSDFTLQWLDGSIYEIDISREGRKATVIYRDAICPNFGSGYCGSGGCSFIIVVGSQAFSYETGGKPYAAAHGDVVSIAVPLSGYSCTDTNGERGFGPDPCYEFLFWSEAAEDFMSIRNELARVE
jgi:hypothetical protein